jgi:hypothetical protein
MSKERFEAIETRVASVGIEGLEVSEFLNLEMMRFANGEIEFSDLIKGLDQKYKP